MWSLEDRTYKGKYTNSGLRHVEVCIVSVALTDSVTIVQRPAEELAATEVETVVSVPSWHLTE